MPYSPEQGGEYRKTKDYRESQRAYRRSDKGKAVQTRYRLKHRETISGRATQALGSVKKRARKYNRDMTLDKEWIMEKLKGCCELTGIPFKPKPFKTGHGSQAPGPLAPSVDRIDNSKGYTKDNCRMILNCLNMFKGTMTDSQLLSIAEDLVAGLMKAGTKRVRND